MNVRAHARAQLVSIYVLLLSGDYSVGNNQVLSKWCGIPCCGGGILENALFLVGILRDPVLNNNINSFQVGKNPGRATRGAPATIPFAKILRGMGVPGPGPSRKLFPGELFPENYSLFPGDLFPGELFGRL